MHPQSNEAVLKMAKNAGMKVVTFDKGVSVQAFFHEAALTRRLKEQYGVRFLPTQVIRRALREGLNPFAG